MMSKQVGSAGQRLPDQKEIQNAATTLQNLLPRQNLLAGPPGHQRRETSLPALPAFKVPVSHNQTPPVSYHPPLQEPEVFLDHQPYRTTPLVLPHAKTIHDLGEQGNKFVTASKQPDLDLASPPYRTSSLVQPGPRTIHEVRGGGPTFRPYRGPQYYADKGYTALPLPTITQHTTDSGVAQVQPLQLYNSPVNLYSDQALAEALQNKPLAVGTNVTTNGTVATPSPRYQLPAKTGGPPNINQSSSFKKVMYSVMRDSEF